MKGRSYSFLGHMAAVKRKRLRPRCGRLLVGQGTDTWDPTCIRPRGHAGLCEGEK